jgi:hypothetical protein
MSDVFEFARDDTERRINSRVHLRERHGKVEVFKDGELYLERYLIRSQEKGLRAVMDDKPGPKGPWKADDATRLEVIKEYVNEPRISDSEIARRVSARRPIQVDRKMVSRILRHAGLKPAPDSDAVREVLSADQLALRFRDKS